MTQFRTENRYALFLELLQRCGRIKEPARAVPAGPLFVEENQMAELTACRRPRPGCRAPACWRR
ncbi:hypothetical protein EH240_16500 [Mesorhizobium tamadayense]|uniref:Uncharacterized protein n=1 Tax=Mesorhizobium tamadayense TaxID=425306 RepID=A0A3P3FS95_9HYPH|nr:hypothetical protein EH240_16500 [Mesorhizobium tamadayense]